MGIAQLYLKASVETVYKCFKLSLRRSRREKNFISKAVQKRQHSSHYFSCEVSYTEPYIPSE